MRHELLGDAAQHPTLETCKAMATQYDEIGVQGLRSREDRRSYWTDGCLYFCCDTPKVV